ncbi:hypothetical protein DMC47_31405 [Nostoc sp. 3335mG]|nr:hypothetical protein DMC47_31405 [Nostoc sp. 3335mG]
MALSIPFTTLKLVGHASGGTIMRNASGYIANTYVGADVVSAFTTAGSALQAMSSSAVALVSSPYSLGALTIAAVAIGTYCYFYGIPAPVAETLVHAGLAAPSKQGLMIAVPKLATALVLLGAAGYVAYRFYANLKTLLADRQVSESTDAADETAARHASEGFFGAQAWSLIGEAVWATKEDVAAVATAAVDRATALAGNATTKAAGLYRGAIYRFWSALNAAKRRFHRA